MIKIGILLRKSPTDKKDINNSFERQEYLIKEKIEKEIKEPYKIEIFKDVASGDKGLEVRKELNIFFEKIEEYDYAYCLDIDRFSRSYLGIVWLKEIFISKNECNCALRFVNGTEVFDINKNILPDNLLAFGVMCLVAEQQLYMIRKKTQEGRDKAKRDGKKLGKENIIEKWLKTNPHLIEYIKELLLSNKKYDEIVKQIKEEKDIEISKGTLSNIKNKYL